MNKKNKIGSRAGQFGETQSSSRGGDESNFGPQREMRVGAGRTWGVRSGGWGD